MTTPRPNAPPPVTSKPIPDPTKTSSSAPSANASSGFGNQRRIMICAPSNAAVDELVLRLKDGIRGYDGKLFNPSVVRLGRTDAINSNVREFTLEELVERKLEEYDSERQNHKYDGELRKTQNEQLAKRDELRKRQADAEKATEKEELQVKIIALTKKIKETGHRLDQQREEGKVNTRRRDIERIRFQNAILQSAHVVCSTLSGSSHNVLLRLQMYFETIVIDEAAQAVELSTLIPLKYGCKQCIMVGDPNQLPPTVLSQEAASLKYEQSLFVRMFTNHPERVHMLNIQFRMHPEISRFPSNEFYRGNLKDGPKNHIYTQREWHASDIFGPYRFFDVSGQQEQSMRTKSLFNKQEATAALDLYMLLENTFGKEFISGRVGIISPYKEQANLLKRSFTRRLGEGILSSIDFNTIDGFQGQEKDIIIMSCVRASADSRSVGFLADVRRMNVAITRAKSSLWILGNEKSLVGNPVWKRLLDDAKARHLFTHITAKFFSNPKLRQDLLKGAAMVNSNSSKAPPSRPSEIRRNSAVTASNSDIPSSPSRPSEIRRGSDDYTPSYSPRGVATSYKRKPEDDYREDYRDRRLSSDSSYRPKIHSQSYNPKKTRYDPHWDRYAPHETRRNSNDYKDIGGVSGESRPLPSSAPLVPVGAPPPTNPSHQPSSSAPPPNQPLNDPKQPPKKAFMKKRPPKVFVNSRRPPSRR